MSEALKRAGILYGKLGLATPPALIAGRYPGIESAAKALTIEELPELLLVLFGRASSEKAAFLEHFTSDPTFDVRPADKEAALLATAIADFAMTEDLNTAGSVALSVVTASVGGMRPQAVPSEILSIADRILTAKQEVPPVRPTKGAKVAAPAAFTQAIASIKAFQHNHQFLPQIVPEMINAFERLGAYVESVSTQAARINNSLLAQIAKLEEETGMHWWVVGGWSGEEDCSFRDLDTAKAAVLAGWELAGKTSSPLGLHAAPALLDIVLERCGASRSDVTLEAAAKAQKLDWRKTYFEGISGGALGPLLPLSTMFDLSAESNDEDDWKAALSRKTGLKSHTTISPTNLAVQIYREGLVRNMLEA